MPEVLYGEKCLVCFLQIGTSVFWYVQMDSLYDCMSNYYVDIDICHTK